MNMRGESGESGGETYPRAVADLWSHTLSQIPTVLGRLMYLASLRDVNTGRYEHYGMSLRYSADVADCVLRDSHERAFGEWLAFRLKEQKSDLDLYFAGLGDKRKTVEAWLVLKPYKSILPTRVRPADRELYLADFDAILEILRTECGAVLPDPDA